MYSHNCLPLSSQSIFLFYPPLSFLSLFSLFEVDDQYLFSVFNLCSSTQILRKILVELHNFWVCSGQAFLSEFSRRHMQDSHKVWSIAQTSWQIKIKLIWNMNSTCQQKALPTKSGGSFNGVAQSLVSVMTCDMLWHTITGLISWDIQFVLSTSPVQWVFCNENNDIEWINPLGEFSMELLYLFFQKCEIGLFSLPNVAVWRDCTYEHNLQEYIFYLEFRSQLNYRSRIFICGKQCSSVISPPIYMEKMHWNHIDNMYSNV